MRNLRFTGVLVVVLLALATASCGNSSSNSNSNPYGLLVPGKLTIGTDATFAPYESIENSQFVGLDIDLMNGIAKRLNLQPRWVDSSFDTLVAQLATGTFDVAISGMSITAAREKLVNFSAPYEVIINIIVVRTGSTISGSSASDLDGKSLGVQTGSSLSTKVPQTYPGAKVVFFPNTDALFTALLAGQIDAIIVSPGILPAAQAHSPGKFQAVGSGVFPSYMGIGVGKSNQPLLTAINTAYNAMKADGTYAAIYQKWLKAPLPNLPSTYSPTT